MKKIVDEKKHIIRPLFQIICIAITMASALLIINQRIKTLRIHDPYETPHIITPEKMKEFGGAFSSRVSVGLNIKQFEVFDMADNEFIFSGTLWFLLNPGVISLSTLDNFAFSRGEILYKSKPNTRMVGNKLLVEYKLRVKFTSPITYKSFPIGDHRLNITLTHQSLSPAELIFESSEGQFINSTDMTKQGWKEINEIVDFGYTTVKLDNSPTGTRYFPTVTFAIDYSRKDVRYLISIFLPLLLMFFLGVLALSTPRSTALRMASGTIGATLAYRFVIENLSPKVGYFMLTDYLFLLFLFLSFLIFLIIMINSYAQPLPRWIQMVFVAFLHLIVIGSCIYLFLIWS